LLPFLARLACVKRAASVDSEPGSNSRLILLSIDPDPDFHPVRIFNRSGFDSKSLTNYFIASNQIVNELRSSPNDKQIALLKIQSLPASKAVRATLGPAESFGDEPRTLRNFGR
jgi:hypothetical protein